MVSTETENDVTTEQDEPKQQRGIKAAVIPAWVTVDVRGIAPGLLMDKLTDTAIGGGKLNLDEAFEAAKYLLKPKRPARPGGPKCTYGIPADGLKSCLVDAGRIAQSIHKDTFSMVKIRGGVFVANGGPDGYLPIEDTGLISIKRRIRTQDNKSAVEKKSPILKAGWQCRFVLRYNAAIYNQDHIIQLVNAAGFGVGLGGWAPRSQCGGSYGCFEIVNAFAEIEDGEHSE